jgi:hypothetical protein
MRHHILPLFALTSGDTSKRVSIVFRYTLYFLIDMFVLVMVYANRYGHKTNL